MKHKIAAIVLGISSITFSAQAMHCPTCEPPNCTPNHNCHLKPEAKVTLNDLKIMKTPLGTDPEPQ